jgi:predicted dehydrogenase
VRNIRELGGGAMFDIGCYPVTLSRFLYGEEPTRAIGSLEIDPEFGTDRLDSAILEFPSGRATFTCSTQLIYHQRVHIQGTKGRIEIDIPLNPPTDRPSQILIDDGRDLVGGGVTMETIPACDQFTIQGDLFSKAIRGAGEVAVPVEDAIANAAVIEAIFRSAESGTWERPERGKA